MQTEFRINLQKVKFVHDFVPAVLNFIGFMHQTHDSWVTATANEQKQQLIFHNTEWKISIESS